MTNPDNFVAHRQLLSDFARDFGALAAGRSDWLALWPRLDPDPAAEVIWRNLPSRHPVLWLRTP